MLLRFHFLTVILVIGGLLVSNVHAIQTEPTPEIIARGKILYDRSCIFCHGVQGKGDGPAAFFGASYWAPRASDFTVGQYKFRSTASGKSHTDEDLFRIITNGVPGYMPPFVGWPEEDRWHVVSYVKTLHSTNSRHNEKPLETFQIGTQNVPLTVESIEQGRQVYFKFECDACHGHNARGDVPDFEAQDLKDNLGMPIRPTDLDLTNPYSFKNGAAAHDIFGTLMTGLIGTPMPSYADAFAQHEDDAWHLVHYILSLSQGSGP